MYLHVSLNAGEPVTFAVTLAEMRQFGGGDAASLERAFKDALDVVMPIPNWRSRLISATADGASVNFGELTGFLARIAAEIPWLVKSHCANHRVELAFKDVFESSVFNSLDELYIGIFSFLKNSGKARSILEEEAVKMGISYYQLPKLTSTRFVGHRRKSFKAYLGENTFIFFRLTNFTVTKTSALNQP